MKTKITILLILLAFAGCKPKEIIKEKIVKEIDGTEVAKLRFQLDEKTKEVAQLKTEINRFREENVHLRNELYIHTINYNTNAPVNPETGKHPIESETKTESKSVLDSKMREYEQTISDYEKKFELQSNIITEMENQIDYLEKQNSEFESKTLPQSGIKFRLVMIAFLIGLIIPTIFFLRDKIKNFRLWRR